jgi:hypothetical protein
MGIFSRRNLGRILTENARFVRNRQLSQHIRRLNGIDLVQRVTTEWEVVVLNGLSKLGTADHEPQQLVGPTKPDVLFTHPLGPALMDITTVSDRGLDQKNPIHRLENRLVEIARNRGLDPNRFGLFVKGNYHELHLGGPKPRLYIPGAKEFDTAIFNKSFHSFLDEIFTAPEVKRQFEPASLDARVTITYDPTQRGLTMSYLGYAVPFSETQNTIYNALENKAHQLSQSQFAGIKGIILCDGGCDALSRTSQRGLNFGANDIISKFLHDNGEIGFVLAVLIEGDRSGFSGPDHLRVIAKPYSSRVDSSAGQLASYLRENLPRMLPNPENYPLGAYDLEAEGKSHNGGGTLSGNKIKMSSRAIMELLSGKMSQEDFIRDNPHVKDRFAGALRQGCMLKAAGIEGDPQRDDDWIEFTFSEPDPAISDFPKIRGQ